MSSKIEWTNESWNPIVGCSKVSEGCRNCYAERMARRLKAMGQKQYDRVVDENGWTGIAELVGDAMIMKPSTWKHPRKVFVCSMSDLFGESVLAVAIDEVMNAIQTYNRHTFQILTKRPERMAAYFSSHPVPDNVWLGVTVENQEQADKRIPLLLQTPAQVRFVSIEPMLGPVDLKRYLLHEFQPGDPDYGWEMECSADGPDGMRQCGYPPDAHPIPGISWAICGGETGPGARPMHPDWVRNLRDQCVNAEVPFFFKGWGEWGLSGYKCYTNPQDGMTGPWIGNDGAVYLIGDGKSTEHFELKKIGKKSAGRQLDGVQWEQFPEVKP